LEAFFVLKILLSIAKNRQASFTVKPKWGINIVAVPPDQVRHLTSLRLPALSQLRYNLTQVLRDHQMKLLFSNKINKNL
jgi:hypothetical protein